jgi:flavin reductase (DIM6/NTAB) family NADH-FMN oxidoreductase RutF
MISTSLSHKSTTYQLAHRSKAFSISLLRDDQANVAAEAGRHGTTPDKFSELNLDAQRWSDVPALADCAAVMWCSIEQECVVGDYIMCIGLIQSVKIGSQDGHSLLRYAGRYHAMGNQLDDVDVSSYPL